MKVATAFFSRLFEQLHATCDLVLDLTLHATSCVDLGGLLLTFKSHAKL